MEADETARVRQAGIAINIWMDHECRDSSEVQDQKVYYWTVQHVGVQKANRAGWLAGWMGGGMWLARRWTVT